MNQKKKGFWNAGYMPFLIAFAALLMFIFAGVTKNVAGRVILIILSVLALCAGGYLMFCNYRENGMRGHGQNLFLYDRRRKKTVSPDSLNVAFVNDNLTHLLRRYVTDTRDLWRGFPKGLVLQMEAMPALAAPVAFKMLLDLSLCSETEITDYFCEAKVETVAALCRAVKQAGDKEMADFIFSLKRNDEQTERIIPFFRKNKRVFEGRLLNYIKEHLNEYTLRKDA